MSDTDATCKRHRVADPMREFVETYLMNNTTQENEQWLAMTGRSLLRIADEIDREHERRMEQQSHDLRKAWLSQQRTQLELEALRVKASNGGAK